MGAASGGRRRRLVGPLTRAARRHWLFGVATLGAVTVRVLVMLAFRPILWFGGDSASYVATALRLIPDPSRTGGYGLLLALMRPLHSFTAVAAVQHAAGLATGTMIYLVARRHRLPGWAGTLAAVPVLFGAYQLQLEHDVVPDVAYGLLVMLALTVVLWRAPGADRAADGRSPAQRDKARPGGRMVAAAGILGVAGIVWPVGLVLLTVYLLWLLGRALTRAASWPVLAAALVAGAVPVAGYVAWFDASYHQVALTDSDGVFLWARTMSFADCGIVRPPADERGLCPPRSRGPRPASSEFIWQPWSPLLRMPGGRFSPRTNRLALDFATRAILAQPAGYLTAVLHDFMLSFTWNRPNHPDPLIVERYQFSHATTRWVSNDLRTVGGGTLIQGQLAYTGGHDPATRAVQPFAAWLVTYQRYVFLRGTMLGAILLAAAAGIAVRTRRRRAGPRDPTPGAGRLGPAALPFTFAVVGLLAPPAITDFDPRYVVPAVPAACLAAALAYAPVPRRDERRHRTCATSPAATRTSVTDPGAPTRITNRPS